MNHRIAAGAVTLATLALPGAAVAQAPAQSAQRTLTVVATGYVDIAKPKEQTNAAYAAAARAAKAKVAPAAVEAARKEAVLLGFAANLQVGGLLSVGDVPPAPWG